MVIIPRNELGRIRLLYYLTFLLAAAVLFGAISIYGQASPAVRTGLVVLGAVAAVGLVLSAIQIYSFPPRSHALIVHRDEEMMMATNALHEGFKLRFLRDALGENVFTFTDEERARYKPLEADGYYPAMMVRGARKVLLLRLCTMLFDDVYVVDRFNRWEHYDCANTSEPTFNKREMPRLRSWNDRSSISA